MHARYQSTNHTQHVTLEPAGKSMTELDVELSFIHHPKYPASGDYPGDPEWCELDSVVVLAVGDVKRADRPDWFAWLDKLATDRLSGQDLSYLVGECVR